jgi:hypothetical protein
MSFMTSGVANRMYLNSQGYLGIGSTTPLAPLHVVGNAAISTANANQTFFNFTSTTALSHATGLTQNNGASAIFSANVWSNAS